MTRPAPGAPFRDDGGPAFPAVISNPQTPGTISNFARGMSLRDFFAQGALQLLGQARGVAIFESVEGGSRFVNPELVASEVYRLADAMLVEREKL